MGLESRLTLVQPVSKGRTCFVAWRATPNDVATASIDPVDWSLQPDHVEQFEEVCAVLGADLRHHTDGYRLVVVVPALQKVEDNELLALLIKAARVGLGHENIYLLSEMCRHLAGQRPIFAQA